MIDFLDVGLYIIDISYNGILQFCASVFIGKAYVSVYLYIYLCLNSKPAVFISIYSIFCCLSKTMFLFLIAPENCK